MALKSTLTHESAKPTKGLSQFQQGGFTVFNFAMLRGKETLARTGEWNLNKERGGNVLKYLSTAKRKLKKWRK